MTTTRRGPWLWVSTGLLTLLAATAAYVGIAVALSLATANNDGGAAVACTGYGCAAFVAPAVVGYHLVRSRGWSVPRAIRCAAGLSLLVHVALVPVALAAMAM